MTTIKPALELAARAAVAPGPRSCSGRPARYARATSSSRAAATATPMSRSSRSSSDPAATSELCGSGRLASAVPLAMTPRPRGRGRPRRRPDDRRRHPGVRDRPAARDARRSSPRRSAAPTARTHREFRRGFPIVPGERVLLVDDILTTGGSLLAMIPAVEAMGGEIVECVVLVDRSGGRETLTSPTTGRTYPLALALAARPADVRAGRGDLPAVRRGRPALRAREQRDRMSTAG